MIKLVVGLFRHFNTFFTLSKVQKIVDSQYDIK